MLIPWAALRQTVQVEPSLGNTGDGETFGPAGSLRCSLRLERMLVRSSSGDTLTILGTLLARPDATIKARDRVRSGDDVFTVEKVAPVDVGGRTHHLMAWLK